MPPSHPQLDKRLKFVLAFDGIKAFVLIACPSRYPRGTRFLLFFSNVIQWKITDKFLCSRNVVKFGKYKVQILDLLRKNSNFSRIEQNCAPQVQNFLEVTLQPCVQNCPFIFVDSSISLSAMQQLVHKVPAQF